MAGLKDAFRHSVLSLSGNLEARSMLPPGTPLGEVPWPAVRGFWRTQRAFGALLREHKPDLVCTYNWGAIEAVIAATRQLGLPTIHHEDGFGPDEAAGQKARRVWTRRLVLPRAEAVLVPSHNLGRIARTTWKVPNDKLHVIANGVELERFGDPERASKGRAFRAAFGIPQDALVIGTVGTLRKEKNHVRFVQALRRARELDGAHAWHGLLVGEGSERAPLEAAVRAAGLEAHFTFAGYQSDCAPALFAMDQFTLTSDTEQMPISLVEAMAAYVPVTTTDVGDAARMLPAGAESCVVALGADEALNIEQLAKTWRALALDAERRTALVASARAKAVAEYSLQAMVAAYADHYTAALRA